MWSEWVIEWVSEWLSEWLIDWLSEWVSEWVSEWASERASEWVSERASEWVSEWALAASEWMCELVTFATIPYEFILTSVKIFHVIQAGKYQQFCVFQAMKWPTLYKHPWLFSSINFHISMVHYSICMRIYIYIYVYIYTLYIYKKRFITPTPPPSIWYIGYKEGDTSTPKTPGVFII